MLFVGDRPRRFPHAGHESMSSRAVTSRNSQLAYGRVFSPSSFLGLGLSTLFRGRAYGWRLTSTVPCRRISSLTREIAPNPIYPSFHSPAGVLYYSPRSASPEQALHSPASQLQRPCRVKKSLELLALTLLAHTWDEERSLRVAVPCNRLLAFLSCHPRRGQVSTPWAASVVASTTRRRRRRRMRGRQRME